MAEASRVPRRRKQLVPQRLMDVERNAAAWDLNSRLGESYPMPEVENQSQPKRRKKISSAPKPDTHSTVPIALYWRNNHDNETQTPLVLGYFKLVIYSVLTSFLPPEEDSPSPPSEENSPIQSVQLVSGNSESSVTLMVKQTVTEPFCCCFNVSLNPVSPFIPSLAPLVKSRLVRVSTAEDELHNLFSLAAKVALSGDALSSPMSLTLTVHLMDATVFAPTSSATLSQKGAHSKHLISLVSHLNPHDCPSHLRPAVEKNVQPAFLSIFKRIQLFYLTVKDLQRREGAVDGLTELGELNKHLLGMMATLRSYQLRAVGWMLAREGAMSWPGSAPCWRGQHPLWTTVWPENSSKLCGEPFYFNFHTGSLSLEAFPAPVLPKGGILADEMGLGKTVEVLALILLHSRGEGLQRDFVTAFESILTTYGLLEDKEGRVVEDAAMCSGEEKVVTDAPSASWRKPPEESISPVRIDQEVTDQHLTATSADCSDAAMREKDVNTTGPSDALTSAAGNSMPLVRLDKETTEQQPFLASVACSGTMQSGEEDVVTIKSSATSTKTVEESVSPVLEKEATDQSPPVTSADGTGVPLTEVPPVGEEAGCVVDGGSGTASDVIVCVCGVSREEGGVEYIQCEECQTWQHSKCVGFRGGLSARYSCIFCIGKNPIEAKTTLIISPQSIARQWLDEVKKHTEAGTLSAIFYNGVEHMIHPFTLASHDIVITTYNVLRKEVYYATTDGSKKSLRHKKKYRITPSPLMTIKWWRLCVDEAQMVESETTKAAEMCLQLQAENRWFVTGTPIQREISDLYGLLLLLGVEPYSTKHWWNQLLWEPYLSFNMEPIAKVFSQLLWRSSKKDVAVELGIPEQVEEVEWLSFSPVEEHFYQRQQDKSLQEAQRLLDYFAVDEDARIANLQQYAVNQILTPLLRLRQACLHPHVVRGGIVSMKKTSMTMNELLKQLIKKCKMEAQEGLRQLIGALNGLAGIFRIQMKWTDAVEMYRSAMSTWQEHMPELECDFTQRIHTLEGLAELLQAGHCPLSRAVSDSTLLKEAAELRKKFLEKKEHFVVTSREALLAACASTDGTLLEEVESLFGYEWPVLVLGWLEKEGLTREMLAALQVDVSQKIAVWSSVYSALGFSSAAGVQFWILDKWRHLQTLRREVMECVHELCSREPTSREVMVATHCHLRIAQNGDEDDLMEDSDREKCWVCQVEALVDSYEMTLFSASRRVPEEGGGVSHGSRGESALEVVMRSLVGFARSKNANRDYMAAADCQFETLEEMKKEFPLIRQAWQAASERLQGFDELSQASLRFRKTLPGEPPSTDPHVLQPFEVEPKRLSLLMEKGGWESELRKAKGQLYYLQSLEKARDIETDNLDNCPICIQQLGRQWCVLTCGHSICVGCIEQMQKNNSPRKWPFSKKKEICCPVCRAWVRHDEINVVSTVGGQGSSSGTKVEGDHSTKIEAIIRKIAEIQTHDPSAKTLVFSQWVSLLDLLAKGLKQNGIDLEYPYLKGVSGSLQKSLTAFKTLPSVGVLLLPLNIGSNGLNITEATHVVLCEPALNPSAEQQAVGRVHRMGQTRRTFVHRFYVKGTVEEKMYRLLHPEGEEGLCTDRLESVETSEKKSELTIREFRELFKA